jgi:hypothetical protein
VGMRSRPSAGASEAHNEPTQCRLNPYTHITTSHSSTIDTQPTTTRQLRRLDGCHLMRPALRRLRPPRGAHLIGREARNANVVLPLENHLDVTGLEGGAAAQLTELASRGDEVVDEVIGDLKEDLWTEVLGCVRTK